MEQAVANRGQQPKGGDRKLDHHPHPKSSPTTVTQPELTEPHNWVPDPDQTVTFTNIVQEMIPKQKLVIANIINEQASAVC
eukprot:5958605-Amphidinium_carterae.1